MRFGLRDQVVDSIASVLAKEPRVKGALVFGSRAKGNYKEGSDLDLCLEGEGLDLEVLSALETELDDLYLPWKIDLIPRSSIDNEELLAHIERVGQVLFAR